MNRSIDGGLWKADKYSQLPLHYNTGLELVYVRRGGALWQVDGEDIAVDSGQLFFTFPWQKHGSSVPLDHAIEAWWLVLPMHRHRGGEWRFITNPLNAISMQHIIAKEEVLIDQRAFRPSHALTLLMEVLIEKLNETHSELAQNQQHHLAAALVAEWIQNLGNQPLHKPKQKQITDNVVRSWRHICLHHQEPWTLISMAKHANLGRSQFSDSIIALTGTSPVRALNRERLGAAARDLVNSRDSIIDIAIRHGFHSARYFSRIFRQHTQLTPTEFRKQKGPLANGWNSKAIDGENKKDPA